MCSNSNFKKSIPSNWPNDVTYLYHNDYISTSLKPSPYDTTLIKSYPVHPFTSSLLPVAIMPKSPNPLVKIKSLKDQKDHPAYPGNGLFAAKDLKESTLIINYNGKVVSRENFDDSDNDYVLRFVNNLCIDGFKQGFF